MYVCLCNAVTEKHIADAIADGASCLKDLRSSLQVTATCGRCKNCAMQCLRNSLHASQVNKTNYSIVGA